MKTYQYLFGPVPSRRMGLSVGVSPIPRKYCNYSCIYCQLGRTNKLSNTRESFFEIEEILSEFKDYLKEEIKFDVVTIVGEGEPTLYKDLKELILGLKHLTKKPVAVITNGSLLYKKEVRSALYEADIVLPSLDAYDEESFKRIDRPFGKIKFQDVYDGLIIFSKEYKGQLWIETMMIKDINDDEASLLKMKNLLKKINYERLYINTPVRPPAEERVKPASKEAIERAVKSLGGISIDMLHSEGFFSEEKDDYMAILSIIKRHPMNQYEIDTFLKSRKCEKTEYIFEKLNNDKNVDVLDYKGYITYRYR
ncbi:radical SAM protein [Crassaminicella indica]|uniref:Radical SAM protein n=2 Tax=Crassaminicella indica TaxID=2855394 RepID=A0ABX8RF12_9CLOT|nr:radical SAM protein [Crassaminicella indica]